MKRVGYCFIVKGLSNEELDRTADVISGLAADMIKREHKGGFVTIYIAEETGHGSEKSA